MTTEPPNTPTPPQKGLWIAEIRGAATNALLVTLVRHRNRKTALNVMANSLRGESHFQEVRRRGESAMYAAGGDMFAAASGTPTGTIPVLQIGRKVYRVYQEEQDTPVEG